MNRLALVAVLLAAPLAVTACDTLAVRTTGEMTPLFRAEYPRYAGEGRDFRVVTLDDGKTLGGTETLRAAMIEGLQKNARFPTRFTATPRNHDADYRVALIFNPAPNVQARDLCREPIPSLAFAAAGETHLLGAFCLAGDLLVEANAFTNGIAAAGDSRFQAMMKAFTLQLFPMQDLRPEDTPAD
ncbi:MAG: hypothetical protein ACK4NA_05260 [Alphaproteobacteria bacterium]